MNVFEFNSDRKRMSVIVRTPDDKIMIVCKGADSIINARLIPGQETAIQTNKHLEKFAEVGLRTLLISYKYIDEEVYKQWCQGFKIACASTHNRDKEIDKC
jgi:phospholipid-translocating ATPase